MASTSSNELSWQEQLELAAQLVAVIAVGGYISHRAHLNRLGVPASMPLSVERYLAEAWYAVDASVVLLFTFLLGPLVLLLGGSILVTVLARRNRLPRVPAWLGRLKPNPEILPVPLGLLVGLLFILGTVCRQPTDLPLSVAVGPLNADDLMRWNPTEAQATYGMAMVVWLLCVSTVLSLAPESRSRDKVWLAWIGCRAMLPLGVIALFMHFGGAVHESTYPSVEVRHGRKEVPEEQTTSGVLVLESPESLIIWSTRQGSGILTSIPREAVHAIHFGPDIDILAQALEEAKRSKVAPTSTPDEPSPPPVSAKDAP